MANATVSALGQVNQAGPSSTLFLKVFSSEVLSAFQRENKMLGMTSVRTIQSGRSSQFPRIGLTQADYHVAGTEITGDAINHAEVIINIDEMLLASSFVAEIDELKNHYDVRSTYSKEMGSALAKKTDQHLLQLTLLGARGTNPVTGLPDGTSLIDADANTNMASLIDSIFEGSQKLDENDVPEEDRYCVVAPDIYYKLVQNDKILNRDFSSLNGDFGKGKVLEVAGIKIVKLNTAVNSFTNLSGASTTGQNNTYTGDFSTTVASVFHKSAVGTVKLKDLSMESERDIRRQGTLLIGKYAMGHNVIRHESCFEIKTA
jgi:hypothetical protein